MALSEVLKTRKDLSWTGDQHDQHCEFSIDDRTYGISASLESVHGFSFVRVDFHFKSSGGIQHATTNFQKDSFKVLGIVSTGIAEKFNDADCIYFLAKSRLGAEDYESRVKLYRRLLQKLSVEHDLIRHVEDLNGETVFALCKTDEVLKVLQGFI